MITSLQAALLGFLQGFTELFPVSSLGHSVLLPKLLGWNIDQSSDQFVSFIVLTHLATALVLVAFFSKDWTRIVASTFRSLLSRRIDSMYGKIGWLLIIGTIPAGLIGLIFQKRLESLFDNPELVASVLVLNGILLYLAEYLRRRAPEGSEDDRAVAGMSYSQALFIGLAQCLALIPGFSRTGATMTAGLRTGLSHADAARFSFLLATPIILAAAVLKVPHVLHYRDGISAALIGAACATVSAYFSIRFLVKYFETRTLKPFALYCILAGSVTLILLRLSA